jgi:predicted RNA-binding Zn ribbon-like protein
MPDVAPDEGFLLALLNTTPVIDGEPTDALANRPQARRWLAKAGGLGTDAELERVIEARTALQLVVRGQQAPDVLGPVLRGAVLSPAISDGEINWNVTAPPERELALRAVLTWDALTRNSPGRLRPCANDECQLFLIDRSKAGTARWCSMASCGNRMKARRHYQKSRNAQGL